MLKNILSILVLTNVLSTSFSQTIATNFTTNDCEGISYDLFDELDNGKVVIIAWVMPCGACISSSLTAYNIAESYEAINPGRILYFLVDDYGDTDCTVLTNWGETNGIGPNLNVFASGDISMADYGTAGMPKVVVLGGSEHIVYFNKNGAAAGNVDDLEQAVLDALASDEGTGLSGNNVIASLAISAILTTNGISVNYELPYSGSIGYQIINAQGQIVNSISPKFESSGSHENTIDMGIASRGIYYLRFVFENEVKVIKFNL